MENRTVNNHQNKGFSSQNKDMIDKLINSNNLLEPK
jgi:hypothetical protein